MSTDIKLNKAEISKIVQSGGFLHNKADSNTINIFQRKISGKGAVEVRKIFTLFISNEDMNDIIKIIKSVED